MGEWGEWGELGELGEWGEWGEFHLQLRPILQGEISKVQTLFSGHS